MGGSPYIPTCTEAEEKALDLTKNRKTELAKYKAITGYVSQCFSYDYIRAIKLARTRGILPDVERTWKLRMGICQDIASMTVGMLRAVGVESYLCIGKVSARGSHAWVEAIINGKTYRYDHSGKAKKYHAERKY